MPLCLTSPTFGVGGSLWLQEGVIGRVLAAVRGQRRLTPSSSATLASD